MFSGGGGGGFDNSGNFSKESGSYSFNLTGFSG